MNAIDSLSTTPMERYLARTSHGQGMVFDIVLILEGQLDLERLRRAWFETIQQHPRLLASLIGQGRRQRWQLSPQSDPRACVGRDGSFVYRQAPFDEPCEKMRRVDPRAGMGIRCLVQSADRKQWTVSLIFHHACCDGVGAIRIFGQFAKRYVQLLDRDASLPATKSSQASMRFNKPKVVDVPTQLDTDSRSQNTLAPTGRVPDLRNLWPTIRGSNIRLSRHAAMNHSADARQDASCFLGDQASISRFAGHDRLLFSRQRTEQIRASLKAANCKLNDWAIAITMRALANMTAQANSPSRHLMVLNPVETRSWRDRSHSHNHIGLAYIRRTHRQLSDFKASVQSISQQMESVRQHGTSTEMEFGIAIAEAIPGGLTLFERTGTFTPTASVTSLTGLRLGKRFGVMRRERALWIGNAMIQDIFFDAPIQSGGELSIAIWEHDGRLALSCRTAPRESPSALTRCLFANWVETTWDWLSVGLTRSE